MRVAATDESRTLLYPSTVSKAQLLLEAATRDGRSPREPCHDPKVPSSLRSAAV